MKRKRVLQLNLYRVYFDAIACGEKREEYRRVVPHWTKRIEGEGREFDEILFTNGYRRDAATMRVEYRGWHFGHWQGERVYVLRLGRVLSVTP